MAQPCGAAVAFALEEKVSPSRQPGQSARSQKWLEQLCQVESRLLTNWEEFSTHRSEVQERLKDLQESLQRKSPRNDQHLESELERCKRRMEQLSADQEETAGRIAELKQGMESGKDSVEGLRARVAEKLQELAAAFEEQQREVGKLAEDILHEAAATSKRQSKSVAEELLRKMEELNSKLGENMSDMEEQNTSSMQKLRQDLRDLATRLEGCAAKGAAEAEARKVEARLEAALRSRETDTQAQLSDLSHGLNSEASRLSSLEGHCQGLAQRLESLAVEAQASKQNAARAEAQLEEMRSSLPGHLGRLRDELLRSLREAQATQQTSVEHQIRHMREEIEGGTVKEAMRRLDALTESLREMGHEQETELGSLQEAIRNADLRAEKLAAEVASARSAVAGAQEESSKELFAARNDLSQQLRQARQQIEERQEQRLADFAPREELKELRSRHASKLDSQSDELSRLSKALDAQTDASGNRELEWRRRLDILEQAVSEFKDWTNDREERFKAASLDLAEQVGQAREETLRLCREQLEDACRTGQRQREKQDRSISELQISFQELGLGSKELQGRLEATQASLREQVTALQEQSRQMLEECTQQSKTMFGEAKASSLQVKELLENSSAEARRAQETQSRRQEVLERQAAEAASKLVALQERQEALKAADAERNLQLDRVSRTCVELTQSRAGIISDVEASQRAVERQLEDVVRRIESRIEAVSAATNTQCSDCFAASKASAQELAEGAERAAVAAARESLEHRASELKAQLAASEEAWRHDVSKLRAAEDARSRELRKEEEARVRELGQLKVAHESALRELKQELKQQLQQFEFAEEARGKELKYLEEARARELAQLKTVDETRMKDISQLQVSEEALSKELQKLQTATEALGRELRQKDEHTSTELGRLQLAEESLRREVKQKEENHDKDLSTARAGLETKLAELRERSEGFARELTRKSSSDEILRKDLDERSGVLGKDLRSLQAKQESLGEELRHLLHTSLEASAEELRRLLHEGLASTRADAGERESRLVSRLAFTSQEAQELKLGLEEQIRRQVAEVKDQVVEVHGLATERLKQQSMSLTCQVQETKASLEDAIRSQATSAQERAAELQKEAREKAAQVSEETGKALVELRATTHSLGLKVQTNQDQAVELQKKCLEMQQVEERLQKSARDLQQQAAELQQELKTTAEHLSQHQTQQADLNARQIAQFSAQIQEAKEVFGSDLREAQDASKEHFAKLRAKADEHGQNAQLAIDTLERSQLDITRKTEQRIQEIQKQLLSRFAEDEAKLESLQEELAQRIRKEKKHSEEASKLAGQLELLEQRLERHQSSAETHCAELEKSIDVSTRQADAAQQELQRSLEAVRADAKEEIKQLSITVREAESRAKSRHEDLLARHTSVQSLASEAKAAATAAAAEATRGLEAAELRWADKICTEVESLTSAVKGSREEALSTLEKAKAQLTTRLDQADHAVKELAKSSAKDLEERSRRHAEVEERLGSRLAETSELVRRQGSDHAELVNEVRCSSSDNLARVSREAAEASGDLRRKLDDWADRTAGDLREVQVSLMARLSEVQAEARQNLTVEKNASTAMVAELGKQQEERMQQLASTVERERVSHEEHRKAQQDLLEKFNNRLQDQSEAASQALTAATERLRVASEERALQLESQISVTDKDLRSVREELPAMSRRMEADRQAQASGLEELKKVSADRHQQVMRRIQGESEQLLAVAEKLSASQEEWKARHKETLQANATALSGLQAASEQMHKELQDEIAAAQAEMRASANEVAKSQRTQREKHAGAITELGRVHEDWIAKVHRRFEELEALTAQSRLIGLVTEHVEGLVRGVTQKELTQFQREALDSVEWKLERCVQWLHGANVKLGLNPQGTMFSTDRFREMLFDEQELPAGTCGYGPSEPRMCNASSRVRSSSARGRVLRGRSAG